MSHPRSSMLTSRLDQRPSQPLRIALLSPKGPLYHHASGIFRRFLRAAPLTLTTLASLIPPELDASVAIHDEGVEDLPEPLHADLIGMTIITGNAQRAYELADRYRAQGKAVVLGGPHVTLLPEEASRHADSIVTGYAEETWPQLLRDHARGRLQPRYDMEPGFSFHRLSRLPFPRRELLRRREYSTIHTFEATRGCVHDCEFCIVPAAWGRKPFLKPVSHVIDDIRRTAARRVLFYDLNLIADVDYARELLTALVPLRVHWFGLTTVLLDRDPQLLELVARSGCRGLLVGFESLSKESLGFVRKAFNQPVDYAGFVRRLHDAGIAVNGTFVFGADSDDRSVFDATGDFVLENKIDLPRFAVLTPFPSTALYRRLEREGRIIHRDWGLYDGQHVVFQPARMSPGELRQGHERVWREVYSFRSIRRRVSHCLRNLPVVLGANLAYRYYARRLERFYTCTGGAA